MRLLVVIAALILPMVAYYPVNEDREKRIRTLDKEVLELDKKIEQAKVAQRKLPQFREEQQRLDVEVVKLRHILPPDPELDDVRNIVDTSASKASVQIGRFQPRQPVTGEYVQLPIDAEATGTLMGLQTFFTDLSNKYRIINITDITLQKVDAIRWRARFLMTTSSLPERSSPSSAAY